MTPSRSSAPRSTPGSTPSTPRTPIPRAKPKPSWARPSKDDETTSCSRRRSTSRWATIRTTAAIRGGGSRARSRAASGGCAPITSTCTRCTAPIRTPTSTKRSARSRIWCGPGKCGRSAVPLSPPRRSSKRSGWPKRADGSGSGRSSPRTRCWRAVPKSPCCRPARGTGWACSPGAHWRAGCSPAATAATGRST